MNNFYIYSYLRKNGTPYYIGKGEGVRAYKKSKGEVGKPCDKSRIVFLMKNISEKVAFHYEKVLISHYGRIDLKTGILRNKTNGGEGSSGTIVKQKTRKQISAKMTGQPKSEKHKKNISLGKTGQPKSKSHKENLSKSLSGKPWSKARRDAQNRKKQNG